jgi:hypothetical protein
LDDGPGQYHIIFRIAGPATGNRREDYIGVINCRRAANGYPIPSVPGSFVMLKNQ